MEESFLFLLLSYAPHPNPLPKGEGNLHTRSSHTGLMRTKIV